MDAPLKKKEKEIASKCSWNNHKKSAAQKLLIKSGS